jgi:hypothetical protein
MTQKACTVEGCEKIGPVVRGMCNAHYLKVRRYGDPHFVAKPPPPEGHKVCCQCLQTLPRESFNRLSAAKDGLYPSCRDCTNARKRARYAEDPDSVLARNYASRQRAGEAALVKARERWATQDKMRQRENFRRRHLMRKFGITPEDYQRLHDEQRGLCASCGQPEIDIDARSKQVRYLAIDHCHATGKVRGLLCRRCNTALGLLGDDVTGVRRLLAYLE